MCFSKCFSPCGGFGGNPCDQKACTVCGSQAGVSDPCDCFGYNPCHQKRAVCASLSVFHLVVVLVTTREACTVCGSLAGVFPPCDCFG